MSDYNYSKPITTLLISLGKESYSNVSIPFEGTNEEAIEEGRRLIKFAFGGKPENIADQKTMADLFYNILNHTNGNHIETYEELHAIQKQALSALNNALNRKPPSK